jgi:hypothetical protein
VLRLLEPEAVRRVGVDPDPRVRISPAIRWLSLVGIIRAPLPWTMSVGLRIAVSRWSAAWSGMPHSTIAS